MEKSLVKRAPQWSVPFCPDLGWPKVEILSSSRLGSENILVVTTGLWAQTTTTSRVVVCFEQQGMARICEVIREVFVARKNQYVLMSDVM